MRKHERAARWVEVEALCLCAGLERQFGFANAEAVEGVDAPGVVKRAALRLLRQDRARTPRAGERPRGQLARREMTPLAP